jgi:hypothetical protein
MAGIVVIVTVIVVGRALRQDGTSAREEDSAQNEPGERASELHWNS